MYSAQSASYRAILYLFDLNQWFSAQMPDEYSARSGPRYTAQHDLTQVLDARSLPISIDVIQSPDNVFICKNPRIQFDSYYHPNAYSFRSMCLLESEIVCVSHLGVHEKLLRLMRHGKTSCLLAPERYFDLAVKVHLQPLFMEPLTVYHRLEEYSQEDQRKFLLSLLFDLLDDYDFESFLKNAAKEWSLGTFDSSGCSVSFLVSWAWEHITRSKQYVDKLCITLFDFSAVDLSERDNALLSQFICQVDTVLRLYRLFSADNHVLALTTSLDQRSRTLSTLLSYYKTMSNLLQKKLLPESHSIDVWSERNTEDKLIPYPVTVMREYADQRRKELTSLSSASRLSSPSCRGLYMVDNLVSHLSPQGEAATVPWGDTPYPPPRVQTLLRLYLSEEVPGHVKDMLLYYVLLDVHHFMPNPA
ncbi:hypothetical protein WDU94_006089 [Cyamophila willieti]